MTLHPFAGKTTRRSMAVIQIQSNSAWRRTLGSDSTRDYTGVERSFLLICSCLYTPRRVQLLVQRSKETERRVLQMKAMGMISKVNSTSV